ncbi:hypothetical protein [Pseudanabaena sp. BC1403]|uniref:hypothetical protein n=1 Tax=Pseudanabaena sp. BC1403 TaxID=2043171 RepID=UPI000CD9C638|nr:hypothetical protein [Pseudanabaena sp. BC1403]
MAQELSRIPNSQDRVIGRWLLAIATIIFGASNAIASKLHDLGDTHLIDGRNPISLLVLPKSKSNISSYSLHI